MGWRCRQADGPREVAPLPDWWPPDFAVVGRVSSGKAGGSGNAAPSFFGSALGPRDVVERPRGFFEGLPQLFPCIDGVIQAIGLVAKHLVGCID